MLLSTIVLHCLITDLSSTTALFCQKLPPPGKDVDLIIHTVEDKEQDFHLLATDTFHLTM